MSHPICLGDATSSGGTVISCQLEGTHTLNGKTPAVVGDKAKCSACAGRLGRNHCDASGWSGAASFI